MTARSRKPHIKIYEEERELTMMLLVDVSASRMFGTTERLKKNIITEIAAVLAFSAAQNNDKVGCIFFSDKVEKFIPPKKGRSHILMIIRELVGFRPESAGTKLSEPVRFLTNVNKKRCTTFIPPGPQPVYSFVCTAIPHHWEPCQKQIANPASLRR